jgi:trans-AT polyketide synthase, acyltransferase and oxidoreductase domains
VKTVEIINSHDNGLNFHAFSFYQNQTWKGSLDCVSFDRESIRNKLLNLTQPCYIIRTEGKIGVTNYGYTYATENADNKEIELLAFVAPTSTANLGDPNFLSFHGVKYAYSTGAMAGGIASEEMIIALGKAKILASFGAGGLSPDRLETAINTIQAALPNGPYAFNLIHSPNEPAIERRAVELYLKYGVRTIEASAFLDLTPNLVHYRVAGLELSNNEIEIKNKVIAKVSRREVATKFLQPAPQRILKQLVEQGLITQHQALLAEKVPIADDITVEADSGGHTDNRPLVCLLPSMLALRDEMQAQYKYKQPVRVGVAGGIANPQSALAGFMMGAAYIVTGSINQSCVESGSCQYTKELLAQAEMADVMMAPAADMFEMGVKLQVLKRGTLFPMRAQKLYELYRAYNSIEEIPLAEREKLEKQVFRKSIAEVWEGTVTYLTQRNPEKLAKAVNNPKFKMALIFRWYLGLSSRWSNSGEKGREVDYQIWCGPAMGSFNDWARGTYLEAVKNRHVVDIANHLMIGTGYLYRIQSLKLQGLQLHDSYTQYYPASSTLD